MNFIAQALARSFPEINPVSPDKFDSVSDVLMLVVNGFLILAGALAVIYIIWSGFVFITSAGNPEAAQKAKSGIVYAVIGIIVISLSFAIVRVVGSFVGTTPTTPPAASPADTTSPGSGRLPQEGSGGGGAGGQDQ